MMRRAIISILATLLAAIAAVAQAAPTDVKIKIEAPELDKRLLLSKLNEHGPKNGMKFTMVEEGFDYRISFQTAQGTAVVFSRGSGGSANKSNASATVYDTKGTELFEFTRANRNTDDGAANAVSKEIIKRLNRWRALNKTNP